MKKIDSWFNIQRYVVDAVEFSATTETQTEELEVWAKVTGPRSKAKNRSHKRRFRVYPLP